MSRCFFYYADSSVVVVVVVLLHVLRLQQYARDARKEYTELGSKDLSELKNFVKGLPKLLLLDRLSDLAVPVAEVVKEQVRGVLLSCLNDLMSSIHHRTPLFPSFCCLVLVVIVV